MGGCCSTKHDDDVIDTKKRDLARTRKEDREAKRAQIEQAQANDPRLVEIVVPRGARGGDVITVGSGDDPASVRCDFPRRMRVGVPHGLRAGESFLVRVPEPELLQAVPCQPAYGSYAGQQEVIVVHRGYRGRGYGYGYDPYYDPYYDPLVPLAGGLLLGAVLF